MKNQEIFELLNKFSDSNITELKLKMHDFEIEIKKEAKSSVSLSNHNIKINENDFKEKTSNLNENNKINPNNFIVTAPLVASFYEAPSPEKEAFVKIGDIVKEGQVLFILEAMKMINEIKSPVNGKIVNIFPKDGELVEYEQNIMEIEVL